MLLAVCSESHMIHSSFLCFSNTSALSLYQLKKYTYFCVFIIFPSSVCRRFHSCCEGTSFLFCWNIFIICISFIILKTCCFCGLKWKLQPMKPSLALQQSRPSTRPVQSNCFLFLTGILLVHTFCFNPTEHRYDFSFNVKNIMSLSKCLYVDRVQRVPLMIRV